MTSSRTDLIKEILDFEISIKENREIMEANFYKTYNEHTASCFLWAIDNEYKFACQEPTSVTGGYRSFDSKYKCNFIGLNPENQ
jgi:hypothetical protein